jgi:hypothetical protein
MRTHPEVKLNRRPFSEDWEVVRVASDGVTITDRWPLQKSDSDLLESLYIGVDGFPIERKNNGT